MVRIKIKGPLLFQISSFLKRKKQRGTYSNLSTLHKKPFVIDYLHLLFTSFLFGGDITSVDQILS